MTRQPLQAAALDENQRDEHLGSAKLISGKPITLWANDTTQAAVKNQFGSHFSGLNEPVWDKPSCRPFRLGRHFAVALPLFWWHQPHCFHRP